MFPPPRLQVSAGAYQPKSFEQKIARQKMYHIRVALSDTRFELTWAVI